MNKTINHLPSIKNLINICLLSVVLLTTTLSYSKPAVMTPRGYQSKDALIQYSTIGALMQGYYDGDVSMKEIKQYGDIGIGTFNHLDGEMILIDHEIYQVTSSGTVNHITSATAKAPFMVVTKLIPDTSVTLSSATSYKDIKSMIDLLIKNPNCFYVIRIDGQFRSVKTRSVPPQEKPYPVLSEVTKHQSVFKYENIKGTILGFWCPQYADGINVPGYHLHFISQDRKSGGHLLEADLISGTLKMEVKKEFVMRLPASTDFGQVELGANIKNATGKVEK